jgi:hypothetical protein
MAIVELLILVNELRKEAEEIEERALSTIARQKRTIKALQDKDDEILAFPAIDKGFLKERIFVLNGISIRGGDNTFICLKREKLEISKFTLDNMVFNLPKEMVFTGKAYIGGQYNKDHKLTGSFVLNKNLKGFPTFHSNSIGYMCLGDMVANTPTEFSLENLKQVIANVESLNNDNFDNTKTGRKLSQIRDYIRKTSEEYYQKANICPRCKKVKDDCCCERCENCELSFDDCTCHHCERCDNYIGEISDNWCFECDYCGDCCDCDKFYCEDCGKKYNTDDNDQCDRCAKCANCCDCKKGD